jgi:hypothetical protein
VSEEQKSEAEACGPSESRDRISERGIIETGIAIDRKTALRDRAYFNKIAPRGVG